MTAKHLLFRSDAQTKILRGATALANAVRITLGPKSKRVLIHRKWGNPLVCDDGVTIAKEIELKDPEEDLGARMIRQAAERTGDEVGDGTTTSAILAHAIFSEGLRNVVAGASAIDLKRGLDRGVKAAVQALVRLSKPVRTALEKEQVATISAHNDESIGQLTAQAVERVGSEGVVTVEEARGTETSLDVVEGMQFDRGFLSPYFISSPDKDEAVLENPLILFHEKKITRIKEMLGLLEAIAREGKPLLVVAEDVDGEALATLVVNKVRGIIPCAAVKAPGYGDRRRAMLEDMALLTGGRVITADLGINLEAVGLDDLGRADRVVLDRDSTTIIGGQGTREAIEGRLEQIRRQIDDAKSDYDKEKLQERMAKLAGGVAVIRVGAPSESELKSRKEAFDDAISSTKAAVAEGIVPGGGLALLRALDAVKLEEDRAEGDEKTGLRVLAHALEEPARQIARNSAVDPGVVVARMRESHNGAIGFDGRRGEYVDLVERGIIDPTKVVRVALENAASVAGLLLLTEATLTEEPSDEGRGHLPPMP